MGRGIVSVAFSLGLFSFHDHGYPSTVFSVTWSISKREEEVADTCFGADANDLLSLSHFTKKTSVSPHAASLSMIANILYCQ